MLTLEVAADIWSYDQDTGYFFWKTSPKYDIAVGSRAGWHDGKYWRLRYRQKNYKASRVAWLMMTGGWPKDQVDHINGSKLDDRFINLREATNAENCRNRPLRKDNKLSAKGVHKTRYAYVAQVSVDGARTGLGSFRTREAAKAAYNTAALKLHGKFARL